MRNKNRTRGLNLPDFRPYYKATAIKTVWYWHKDRNTDQWIKIESPVINPCTDEHLIFAKGGKNIQWRKDSLFNKWCWENWSTTCKRMVISNFLCRPKIQIFVSVPLQVSMFSLRDSDLISPGYGWDILDTSYLSGHFSCPVLVENYCS